MMKGRSLASAPGHPRNSKIILSYKRWPGAEARGSWDDIIVI